MQSNFKVVGYLPAWKMNKLSKVRYDAFNVLVYSFAFPDEENDMEIVSFPVEMVQSVYAHACFHSITEDCPDNIIKEIKDGTKVKKNIFDKRLL